MLKDPGFRQWPVCSPRRYLRFDTIRSISSGRLAARWAVFRPPGQILARKSVFCYRAPDFVNSLFVALDDIFDLAPSDQFLNFLNQESYRVPKKSGPRKRFLAIFSCWMVLYAPKQCCMIRAYRCAALDTPLSYIRKKIDPRPPGAQKRAIWPLGGPFSGHWAGFWPKNLFFAIAPRILSMARL